MALIWWIAVKPLIGSVTSIVKTAAIIAVVFSVLIYLGYDPIGAVETYLWDQLIGDTLP